MPKNNVPELPDEVLALAPDILAELLDIKYIKRSHGGRTCYKAGCHGPLCNYAYRKYAREYYAARQAQKGKEHTRNELRVDRREAEIEASIEVAERHHNVIEIVTRLNDLYAG